MVATSGTAQGGRRRSGRFWLTAVIVLLLAGIALDTRIVSIGSENDFRQQAFDPDAFGVEHFPRIREHVLERAPEASQLLADLNTDKDSAMSSHGTMAGGFAVLPVTFTGTIGDGKSGVFDVTIAGMPEGQRVRVQTGPAINGTELRDIPGDISFGQFKNQIEYQDAGSGINRAMSAAILSDIDRDALSGQSVEVTGVFRLINPKNWLVTPVQFEVQG